MLDDNKPLASFENLRVEFDTKDGKVVAVENISFDIKPQQTVCLVGESGSGKSVSSLSMMRLVEFGGGSFAGGKFIFNRGDKGSIDIAVSNQSQMKEIRGNEIAMIFQDPMSSLNPYITIGKQMSGVLKRHTKMSKHEIKERCIEMLDSVGISKPHERYDGYSFELSGGMRQRVMIASALLTNPKLLIADEPTTALDVTVQEKILDLILDVKDRFKMSVIMITHDLSLIHI